jgi:hypothetical protein
MERMEEDMSNRKFKARLQDSLHSKMTRFPLSRLLTFITYFRACRPSTARTTQAKSHRDKGHSLRVSSLRPRSASRESKPSFRTEFDLRHDFDRRGTGGVRHSEEEDEDDFVEI